MDLPEERELVAQARRDPEVFGRIYEVYYPGIFRYSLRRTGDVKTAEDITAETFFKALKNLWKFRWQNIPFSAWIYRIATNEINYYFRRGSYRPCSLEVMLENGFEPSAPNDLETEIEDLESQVEQHRDFLTIQCELKKLPLKYQEVVALRYFENKKTSEIAAILGKKEGTIRSLLSRGLDLLRDKLTDSTVQHFSRTSIITNERQEKKNRPAEGSAQ